MRIKHLELFTDQLSREKNFYSETLGFKLSDESENGFTIKIGWSFLTFKRSPVPRHYHYCFLIPTNQLNEALEWMSSRTTILDIEPGRKTHFFKTWNAESFYFMDAIGNLAEMIVRYDLDYKSSQPFDVDQIICVNEIGMPTYDILATNRQLEHELGSQFWKGDMDRFGTHGNQDGLLLLPNPNLKKVWFPTDFAIQSSPFNLFLEVNEEEYFIQYDDDSLLLNR